MHQLKVPGRFAPNPVRLLSRFARVVSPSFINSALKNEMENTIANIRILDVVRLLHEYFLSSS
jgi:hypothetical protein